MITQPYQVPSVEFRAIKTPVSLQKIIVQIRLIQVISYLGRVYLFVNSVFVIPTVCFLHIARGLLYKSSTDCLIQTVQGEGFMSLYKGFIPTWMRMVNAFHCL